MTALSRILGTTAGAVTIISVAVAAVSTLLTDSTLTPIAQLLSAIATGLVLTALLLILLRSQLRELLAPQQALLQQVESYSQAEVSRDATSHFEPPYGVDDETLSPLISFIQDTANRAAKQQEAIRLQKKLLEQKSRELVVHIQRETQARQAADQAKAQRDNDITNISHELRTPLAGIVAAVEMLEQTVAQGISSMLKVDLSQLSPQQVSMMRQSRTEVREIHTILDEILKPSSYTMEEMVDHLLESLHDIAGTEVKLHNAPFDLEKVFSGTVRIYENMAYKKGLVFDQRIINNTDDKSLFFLSDWARIGQVLSSLLSNASRFTQTGGITVKVEITPCEQDDQRRITFTVGDTGCGISKEEKSRIFNLFHIGEDPTCKEYSGLGTGLAIAKSVAERLSGRVYLDRSEIGKGSQFVFELTLPRTTEQDHTLPEISEPAHQLSLLYVEDSKVNRSVFKQYCDRININLQMAIDGEEGWEKYQGYRFDALIIDCFMPNKNGFELVSEIRAHEKANNLPRVPIFALTADPTDANRSRCIEAGFDEFLTKPYRRSTFNFIIERSNALKAA